MHTRPVWVEISRRNLISNYMELRRLLAQGLLMIRSGSSEAQAAILAVVKANAYGHGMRECSQILAGAGAEWLGVTSVEEGVNARAVCPEARILVMSGIWHGEADAAIEHRLTPIVWETFHLDLLEAAARRRGISAESFPVHLELDTGMSRQGISLGGETLGEFLTRFRSGSPLRLAGVSTHFSAPEVVGGEENDRQRQRLEAALTEISTTGLRPEWLHAGNSATILVGEQLAALHAAAAAIGARLMLRPGLSLYGYHPRFSGDRRGAPERVEAKLSPVLEWKTSITSLRTIDAGESAGYNSTFRAERQTRLALLPMGYADGLNRLMSNRGSVLVRGQRAQIAGRVSMDQTILDVTDIAGVEIGDEAVVIGKQKAEAITATELAEIEGTIPYEVLCNISARVPRVMVD
jgi:alanine racemase